MSKQRQRDRAAREAARAEQRAAAARAVARRTKGSAPKRPAGRRSRSAGPVYRLRRFPPLPWRLKLALALGWLAVAAVVLYLVPSWPARLGLLVLAAAALPLIVVLVRDPSRRTR